jgi:hypothetical protein
VSYHEELYLTNDQLKKLAKKIERPPHTVGLTEATIEKITQQGAAKQDEATRTLQQDVLLAGRLSRAALWKAVIFAFSVSLVVCAGGLAALYFLGGAKLVSADDTRKLQAATAERTRVQAEVGNLIKEKEQVDGEIKALKVQQDALAVDVRKNIDAQRAVLVTSAGVEAQLRKLQELQERFRFKMIKGEDGGVFVEIPPDAAPFVHEGKTYIEVK